MVLHSVRNGVEAALSRALDDAEMWKETALAALNEVKALKKGNGAPARDEEDGDDA